MEYNTKITDKTNEEVPSGVSFVYGNNSDIEQVPVNTDVPDTDIKPVLVDTTIKDNDHSADVLEALNSGVSREQIRQYLQESKGLSPDEADFAVTDSLAQKIKKARQAGITDEQLRQGLAAKKYNPEIVETALTAANANDKYKKYEFTPIKTAEEAQNLANVYENVHYDYNTLKNQLFGIFDEEFAQKANEDITKLNTGMVEELKAHGINAFIGTGDNASKVIITDPETGENHDVDEDFMRQVMNAFANSKYEFAGSLIGGSLGLKYGPGIIGKVAASLAGGAVGASAGRSIDLIANSAYLKDKLTEEQFRYQVASAGLLDAAGAIIGKAVAKTFIRGYKLILGGNKEGALKHLKKFIPGMTDDKARYITKQWEATLKQPPKTTTLLIPRKMFEVEKQLTALATTQPNISNIVARAAAENPLIANQLKYVVNERAKGLQKLLASKSDENTGTIIRKELDFHDETVKELYRGVKQSATDIIDKTSYRFSPKTLGIEPMLKKLVSVGSKETAEDFKNYASQVLIQLSQRDFSGLLNVRQALNDFKYNIASNLSHGAKEEINKALNNIDHEISVAAVKHLPEPHLWLQDWKLAKTEYSKLKILEKNAMYKAFTTAKTEKDMRRALNKFGNLKDVDMETYNQVIDTLPLTPKHLATIETALIENLTDKHTLGNIADLQAIDFPNLAEELKLVNLKTKDSKKLVEVINRLAATYRNDAELSGLPLRSGGMMIQSVLDSTVIQKLNSELRYRLYNFFKRRMPTMGGQSLALTAQLAKLLDNPLHSKTADDFLKMLPKDLKEEFDTALDRLQVETAKIKAGK